LPEAGIWEKIRKLLKVVHAFDRMAQQFVIFPTTYAQPVGDALRHSCGKH
jgi:hypothetical protein